MTQGKQKPDPNAEHQAGRLKQQSHKRRQPDTERGKAQTNYPRD